MKPRNLISVVLLTLLIIYPLSLGPIMRYKAKRGLHKLTEWPTPPAFYRPCVGITEQIPILRDAMESYQWLWMRDVYSIFGKPEPVEHPN